MKFQENENFGRETLDSKIWLRFEKIKQGINKFGFFL